MNVTDRIIQEYKDGDFEKRLNLFLECPSLRMKFFEIDQDNRDNIIFDKEPNKTILLS